MATGMSSSRVRVNRELCQATRRSGEPPTLPLSRSRMTPSRRPPLPIWRGWLGSSETFSRRTPASQRRTEVESAEADEVATKAISAMATTDSRVRFP